MARSTPLVLLVLALTLLGIAYTELFPITDDDLLDRYRAVDRNYLRPHAMASTTRALNYHGKRVAWTGAAHEHQNG